MAAINRNSRLQAMRPSVPASLQCFCPSSKTFPPVGTGGGNLGIYLVKSPFALVPCNAVGSNLLQRPQSFESAWRQRQIATIPTIVVISTTDFKRNSPRPHDLLEKHGDGGGHAHAKTSENIVAFAFENIIYTQSRCHLTSLVILLISNGTYYIKFRRSCGEWNNAAN